MVSLVFYPPYGRWAIKIISPPHAMIFVPIVSNPHHWPFPWLIILLINNPHLQQSTLLTCLVVLLVGHLHHWPSMWSAIHIVGHSHPWPSLLWTSPALLGFWLLDVHHSGTRGHIPQCWPSGSWYSTLSIQRSQSSTLAIWWSLVFNIGHPMSRSSTSAIWGSWSSTPAIQRFQSSTLAIWGSWSSVLAIQSTQPSVLAVRKLWVLNVGYLRAPVINTSIQRSQFST